MTPGLECILFPPSDVYDDDEPPMLHSSEESGRTAGTNENFGTFAALDRQRTTLHPTVATLMNHDNIVIHIKETKRYLEPGHHNFTQGREIGRRSRLANERHH